TMNLVRTDDTKGALQLGDSLFAGSAVLLQMPEPHEVLTDRYFYAFCEVSGHQLRLVVAALAYPTSRRWNVNDYGTIGQLQAGSHHVCHGPRRCSRPLKLQLPNKAPRGRLVTGSGTYAEERTMPTTRGARSAAWRQPMAAITPPDDGWYQCI